MLKNSSQELQHKVGQYLAWGKILPRPKGTTFYIRLYIKNLWKPSSHKPLAGMHCYLVLNIWYSTSIPLKITA